MQDRDDDDFDALLRTVEAEAHPAPPTEQEDGADDGPPRRSRLRYLVPSVLTTVFGAGIALAVIGNAYAGTLSADVATPDPGAAAVQRYVAPDGGQVRKVRRDAFDAEVTVVAAPSGSSSSSGSSGGGHVSLPSGPVAPAGTAQQYAAAQVAAHGWSKKDFACLVPMWARESGWNAHAGRPDGPYGIPQAYPGSKMASAGGDWLNDYKVQVRWGLGYIAGRYGTPCGAWAHWQSSGSY